MQVSVRIWLAIVVATVPLQRKESQWQPGASMSRTDLSSRLRVRALDNPKAGPNGD